MSKQKQQEDKAFKAYLHIVNKYCKDCPYLNCDFRNKREKLKEQKICCEREYDELKEEMLNKKLP